MIIKVVAVIIAVISFFVILRGLTKETTDTASQPSSRQKASQRKDRKARGISKAKKTARNIADDFLALSGNAGRAKEIPAWAMLLHSPLDPPTDPTSWIGGAPKAPEGFVWPCTKNNVRMHFLAQIDLSALSDRENNGLPSQGVLLIFFSYQWTNDEPDHVHSCHFFSAKEMVAARNVPVPDDLETLDQRMGFFRSDQTFIKRGVDLVPFLDTGADTPTGIPSVFDTPALWISSWGLACAEVDVLLSQMRGRVLRFQGDKGKKRLDDLSKRHARMPDAAWIEQEYESAKALAHQGPQMLDTLTAWRDLAQSKPPHDPVDREALDAHFAKRAAWAETLDKHISHILREGAHEDLCRNIHQRALDNLEAGTPDADWDIYRTFFEQKATDWRGHRLFGIEPPFANNWEDLRGQDCLISINADPLLGTMCEHFYGVSIWCPRKDMAKGSLEHGQVVRHCAV